MWDLFQLIAKDNMTPNQLMLLYGIKNKISVPQIDAHLEIKGLIKEGYVIVEKTNILISNEGINIMTKYTNYFVKAKKKTNSQLMGQEFLDNIKKYREMFPAKKLPSGKPGRNNVKVLEAAFRWFFGEYDYSWEQIHKATARYVDEYEDTEYLYMKTSQYFIAKQDKTKVKYSELADYCDVIIEGYEPEDKHFQEKVV